MINKKNHHSAKKSGRSFNLQFAFVITAEVIVIMTIAFVIVVEAFAMMEDALVVFTEAIVVMSIAFVCPLLK